MFLKNHAQNVVETLSHRSYLKKSKLKKYLNQQLEILYSLFLLHVQVDIYQNIFKN